LFGEKNYDFVPSYSREFHILHDIKVANFYINGHV